MNKIDNNDLIYVSKRLPKNARILVSAPVGWAKGQPKFNATKFLLSNGQMMSVFHVKPIYYERQDGAIRPMGEIMSHHGNRRMRLREGYEKLVNWEYLVWLIKRCQLIGGGITMPYVNLPLLVNAVTTVFPDPSVEVSTVDGMTYVNTNQTSWNAIVTAADGGAAEDSTATTNVGFGHQAGTTTDNWNQLVRSFHLFDASSISDSDTIDSAILSIEGSSKFNDSSPAWDPSIQIYSSTPASNTAITTADYDQTGTTAFATAITYANWSTTAYNDFTLNGSGLTNISKTGISKFGEKDSVYDAPNSTPSWQSAKLQSISGRYAETAGTGSDPKLAVTHTAVAVKSRGALSLLRVG